MSASAPSQTVFSIGYDFHWQNGDNGNDYGITNYKDNNRNQTFTYDTLNRLTHAENTGTDCSNPTLHPPQTQYWRNDYVYDAWGNLLQKNVTKCFAESLAILSNVLNRADNGQAPQNGQTPSLNYQYDAAGNMIWNATTQQGYAYDQENRITGSAGYAYTYDADGNRVKKANGSTGTIYWSMTPGIVAESDLNGNTQSEYVFFNGERVARRDGVNGAGGVFYYFSDHLKTASVITDSVGNIKAESDYYPWGGELQFVANDSNHYKFTGKERDSETNLDYFGARYYSNGLGRFITPDWAAKATAVPYADFADPQSLNLYTYVRNIPTTKADANGHCMGDECSNVQDTVKVTDNPAFRTNEQDGSVYRTGVRGQLTISLTQNGKPMANTPVSEKVTENTTRNGQPVKVNLVTAKKPVPTDANGQVQDDFSLQLKTAKPASQNLSNAVKADQTTNTYTERQTQTLTFPGPNGSTCSATYQRTLSNDDGHGNPRKETDSSGSNYKLHPPTEHPTVKEKKSS
jgi:RHS repeat-associated protein